MNLSMAGMDYSLAGIEIRERFALTKSRLHDVYAALKQEPGVCGAVLIATCNRTELYLSTRDDDGRDPFDLLCKALEIDPAGFRAFYRVRRGRDVFHHLGLLSCGAKSQIWGEDQIISQVKNAIEDARGHHAADSVLEVLFRTAITAAKKIKTDLTFSRADGSVADKTARVLLRQPVPPRRVMVIGNGEIGRLVAQTLVQRGFDTSITLRHYKHGLAEAVDGVTTLDYGERYAQMNTFGAVVSATLSPHFTVEAAPFAALSRRPAVMVDLAVPRDIDPAIGKMKGTCLYDVDSLAGAEIQEDRQRLLRQIEPILQKYDGDFQRWCRFKESETA